MSFDPKSNSITIEQLADKIDELIDARETWENGSYKASNDELYRLLDRCTALLLEVQADRKLILRIGKMLTERGLEPRDNTSLATKIVRLVFGDCGKRAYTYANVISVAALEKAENETMRTYVNNRGGIEQISRGKSSKNGGVSRQDNVNYAVNALVMTKPIIPEFDMVNSVQPHAGSAHSFSLAIIRKNSNGKGNAVFGINNISLVNSALIYAAKQLRPKAEAEAKEVTKQTQMNRRRTVVNNIKMHAEQQKGK